MLLTIDCGNSNIKIAIFEGEHLVQYARLSTDLRRTSDEYGLQLMGVFDYSGIKKESIEGIIVSSVVPSINYTLEHMCHTFFSLDPIFVGAGTKTGMNILYDNPKEVGSDRIVTAVAAYHKYGGPVIVVDFGTATTFGVVNDKGQFLGGAIMPGLRVSMESLVTQTAKLPRIELEMPKTVIGKSTISNMQSGIVNGYIGSVDHILEKMEQELGQPGLKVIATGGMSKLIAENSAHIDKVDTTLTMTGLRIIYEKNIALKEKT